MNLIERLDNAETTAELAKRRTIEKAVQVNGRIDYAEIALYAAFSLSDEGRHNQAGVMRDIAAELNRLQAIEKAAVDLFQACSTLTIEDMEKIKKTILAMSEALKGGL